MKSFVGYVGIKHPGMNNQPVPLSGIFINSLAGITTDMIDKIAENEQHTFVGVWDDVQTIAQTRIVSEITAAMMQKFDVRTTGEIVRLNPELPDPVVQYPAADEWRGVRIAFRRKTATFEAFYLNSVWLYAIAPRTAKIRVQNAVGDVLHESVELEFVAGWNEIIVDALFPDDSISITAHAGTGATADTILPITERSCFCQTVMQCCDSKGPTIHGVRINNAGAQIANTGTNVHGIRIDGQMMCDPSAIAFHFRKLFLPAWLFLLGNQICVELLASSTINQHTTVDREQYSELKDHYQVEFEKALQTITAGIRLHDSCCIACKKDVKRVSWRP